MAVQQWTSREIRALRQALRMSVRQFADHLGVSPRLVSKWESGTTSPRPANQSMLDEALRLAGPEVEGKVEDLLTESRQHDAAARPAEALSPLRQLPRDITDFTGRDEEIDRLVGILEAPPTAGVRVVAIHGPAGVGKTVLATHAAHRVRAAFPDGQLYMNLRGTQTQKADVGDTIAGFLGDLGWTAPVPDTLAERARTFRTALADRRILLVLDNAYDEDQVLPLIPGNAECAVLVTSRRRLLRVDGAQHLSLRVMTPEHGLNLLAAVIGGPRIDAEAAAAAEIVLLCGQLPLALRIAAARLDARPATSLAHFAERLRDERARLDMLQDGERAVRASFGVSYQGCDPQVRRAFRLLGILENTDFPAWALAILAEVPVPDAETLLEALVDAELLETAPDRYRTGRYRFHDLLHLYAREQLDAEEAPAQRRTAAQRLLTEYIAMCARATCRGDPAAPNRLDAPPPALKHIHDIIAADPRVWFRAEWPGLVGAVTIAHDADLWQEAWVLAEQLGNLRNWDAGWADWERTMDRHLATARAGGDRDKEARLRCTLGVMRREQGRFPDSIRQLRYGADLFDQLGDEYHKAVIHRALADTFRFTGRLTEGIEHFTIALGMFERAGDRPMVAGTLSGMGDIYRGLSRWDESILCLDKAIALYAEAADRRESARAKVRRGIVWRDRCHYDHAESLFEEALQTLHGLGDRRWEAQTLRHLGIVHRNTRRATAVGYLDTALSIYESLDDARGVAVTLRNLGDTHRCAGGHERASPLLRTALTQFHALNDRRWQARAHASLGDLETALGHYEDALGNFDTALTIFVGIGDRPGQARIHRSCGVLRRQQERFDDSVREFEQAQAIFLDLGDQIWAARALAGTAATLRAARSADWRRPLHDAEQHCDQAGARSPREVENWLFEW
ncbi:tetratricopeptide repeat protein [Nocardia sp. NPDC088792]|uniref:tetratricopeptide repeat protein n=1 Tax=Nocardia sp. NPDC088792 TaxID=3364332 RepID=UPI0037F720EB